MNGARKTWNRLVWDFPAEKHTRRRIVVVAFSGAAKKIYEEVANLYLEADDEELWDQLESRLYNDGQQRGQRAAFYSAYWRERHESVDQFGARLRSQALTLPETVSEESMTHRFIDGLPPRLRPQAVIISGEYDEVVAKTSLVAQVTIKAGAEQFRKEK